MTTLLEDKDILVPDNPDEINQDHDESLNPLLVPEDPPLWLSTPQEAVTFALHHEPSRSLESGQTVLAPNVPFPREIHQGVSGKDVQSHKRALSRARPDLYQWVEFTPLAGEFFMDGVVEWKKSKGLGTTRVLGGRAHESLERTHRKGHPDEWAFDALAIQYAQEYYDSVHVSPETQIRNAIVSAGFYWHSFKLNIAYSQYRPFELGKPPFVPHKWDCSAFVTNTHYAGGAPNPNGRPWDHLGYTGTLVTRGHRVLTINSLLPGDFIFYGSSVAKPGFNAGDPTHVALYVGYRDGAHMVLSMGSYPMNYVRYDYRHDVNHFRHYDVV